MMNECKTKIAKLISESSTTAGNVDGRPELETLTRAIHESVFYDLVAVQETNQPIAVLFGVRHLNPAGKMTFGEQSNYSGKYGSRKDIEEITASTTFVKGNAYAYNDVVYVALEDATITKYPGASLQDSVDLCVMNLVIRYAGEAAPVGKFETQDDIIQEIDFEIDKWTCRVRSRKLKTDITIEVMQDMGASQFDADATVNDVLATVTGEEINKDVFQALITVSKRHELHGIDAKNGIIDLSDITDIKTRYEQGRFLYHVASEMAAEISRTTTYAGTYIVCSARVAAMLDASGWLNAPDREKSRAFGILKNGLHVYVDNYTSFDYMVVGCKHTLNDIEHVGSLFFSPFTENDKLGAYKICVDPSSLQNKVLMLTRYALSVNPYTSDIPYSKDTRERDVNADDFSALAGKSLMSRFVGIKLPKAIN